MIPNDKSLPSSSNKPSFFNFRNMVCVLNNISPSGEFLEFEIHPMYNTNFDMLEMAEILPNNTVFKMLVSYHYGRCCTEIYPRITIDETTSKARFFIHCNTCSNGAMINNFNEYGLFSQSIGRLKNSIFETVKPFVIPGTRMVDSDEDETVDVRGMISTTIEKQPHYFNLIKYMHIYGCTINVAINNPNEISHVISNYNPLKHNAVLYGVIESALNESIDNLLNYLDPINGIGISFKTVIAYDTLSPKFISGNPSYTFRVILYFDKFNDIAIQNITPSNITFKPDNIDFIKGYLTVHGADQYLKNRIMRMCTALLSDSGCLFVPAVEELAIIYEGSEEYISASLRPRIVPFTDNGDISGFGSGNVNVENIPIDTLWLKATVRNTDKNIEMVFPFFENCDSSTMAFVRTPIGMTQKDYIDLFNMFTSTLTGMTACAEDSLYIYWRLYREEWSTENRTAVNRAIPDPFIQINEEMLDKLACNMNMSSDDAIYNVLMTLAGSSNLNNLLDMLDKIDPSFAKYKSDNLKDLSFILQKVFSSYGLSINASDSVEFLSSFGTASARAIQNIMFETAQLLDETAKNVDKATKNAAKAVHVDKADKTSEESTGASNSKDDDAPAKTKRNKKKRFFDSFSSFP